jgi:S-adenosylmethionine:tRNA ribosyltransferase-isomerase
VKTDLFDYNLPEALIAQHPTKRREESRLLVADRRTRAIDHLSFSDLPSLLRTGDLLVRNTARVRPARIHARKSSGGRVECLLLFPVDDTNTWSTLLRPGRRLRPGTRFGVTDQFQAEVIVKNPSGECLVRFTENRYGSVSALAEAIGEMPLPPYVNRQTKSDKDSLKDRERYQTIYARPDRTVAAAAPTAGLHFSPDIDQRLKTLGIGIAEIILHVGLGTFRTIETDEIEAHSMHAETYEIPAKTRTLLAESENRRKIAVGTTSLRALEAFSGAVDDLNGPDHTAQTDIFITPPSTFAMTNGLLTNFHLPRSTLLCLLAAFLVPGSDDGIAWFKEIYSEATDNGYRFLSYGDAMLIL